MRTVIRVLTRKEQRTSWLDSGRERPVSASIWVTTASISMLKQSVPYSPHFVQANKKIKLNQSRTSWQFQHISQDFTFARQNAARTLLSTWYKRKQSAIKIIIRMSYFLPVRPPVKLSGRWRQRPTTSQFWASVTLVLREVWNWK
jgi:hypothetical protein